MRQLFAGIIMCALMWAGSARAELMIEITQGVDNPTAISIVPFGGVGENAKQTINDVIVADLKRSGLFTPLAKEDMLSFPSQEADIHYRDWRVLGSEYILIGQLTQDPGFYTFQFSLFDVLSQKRVLKKSVSGGSGSIRDIAHSVSDAVYQAITGIAGAFSTKIVYVEDLGPGNAKRYRLVRADADGARNRVIFASKQPLLSPAWSNDAKQVAYVSFETSRPAIFRQNLATGAREQLTNYKGLNGAPAWSPDNKKIALVLSKDGNPEIYTLDLATKKLDRITKHFAIDTEPTWTKDGKAIVFTSNRGGSPQIYKVALASKQVERLTFDGNYNARPQISPDGEQVVMIHRSSDVFHIALQNLKSGDLRVLTETKLDESPSIAPNGAMLMYATKHNNKGVLAAVSMDAGVKFRLPSQQGDVREPAWSPYINTRD